MLTNAAAAAVYAYTPHSLVLTDAVAAAGFTRASLPLVLADAAAAAVFATAPLPLVLAEAAAAAVFAPAPLPLVFAQHRAGLLGCERMWRQTCGHAQCTVKVHTTIFVLVALSLWPSVCVPLQHSVLARCGSLRAMSVIRHPTVRRILRVESVYAVGAVLPLSRVAPVSMFGFARSDRCALETILRSEEAVLRFRRWFRRRIWPK